MENLPLFGFNNTTLKLCKYEIENLRALLENCWPTSAWISLLLEQAYSVIQTILLIQLLFISLHLQSFSSIWIEEKEVKMNFIKLVRSWKLVFSSRFIKLNFGQ